MPLAGNLASLCFLVHRRNLVYRISAIQFICFQQLVRGWPAKNGESSAMLQLLYEVYQLMYLLNVPSPNSALAC